MLCEKCGTGVDVLYGKDLYCAYCGHLTRDAEYKSNRPLAEISASNLSKFKE